MSKTSLPPQSVLQYEAFSKQPPPVRCKQKRIQLLLYNCTVFLCLDYIICGETSATPSLSQLTRTLVHQVRTTLLALMWWWWWWWSIIGTSANHVYTSRMCKLVDALWWSSAPFHLILWKVHGSNASLTRVTSHNHIRTPHLFAGGVKCT